MTGSNTRVARTRVAGADDAELFWMLVEPIWPDESVIDERAHIALGTIGQRTLYSAMLFMREVDNGGLQQALWNLEAWFFDLVLESLDRLGAREHAATLRSALDAFFGDQPPARPKDRRYIIDSKDATWLEAEIEPLNNLLYGEERLYPHFRRYVEEHPEEFFVD